VRRVTIQAIRPETVERQEVGRPGLLLGGKYRSSAGSRRRHGVDLGATHETLHRPVAVKFVDARSDLDREVRVARFMHEAQVAASVRHKNVVDIIDFGVHDDHERASRTCDGAPRG